MRSSRSTAPAFGILFATACGWFATACGWFATACGWFATACGWAACGWVACGLAACGGGASAPPDAAVDAAAGDATFVPSATLVAVGESVLRLGPNEQTLVAARYVDLEGRPLPDERIGFALVGSSDGASLRVLETTTDADGVARSSVQAGTTPTAFRVRATAARAHPLYFDVAVGDRGFGRLDVEVRYDGGRPLVRRVVSLHARTSCVEALSADEGDLALELTNDVHSVLFEALPSGLELAVVAVAEGPTGEVIAAGCVAGVVPRRDETVEVAVSLRDLLLVADGTYDLELTLGAAATSAFAAAALEEALAALIRRDGGESGIFVRALSEEIGRTSGSEAAMRFSESADESGLEDRLDAAFADGDVSPVSSAAALADVLSVEARLVVVRGSLVVDAAGIAWTPHTVLAGSGDGAEPLHPIASRFFDSAIGGAVRAQIVDDGITLMRLETDLPLGDLTRALLAALTGRDDLELAPDVCGVLAATFDALPALTAECDRACVERACGAARASVTSAMYDALDALDSARRAIRLEGRLLAVDANGDRLVDRLTGEEIRGAWEGDDGESDVVSGEVSGTRGPE